MAIAIAVVLQYSGETMASLSPRDLQRLERLFDQQMWAFGRDATRPGDNLLVRRGFSRSPPPPGREVSGTYRLASGDLEVELSSLGVRATAGERAVFLDRDPMSRQVPRVDATVFVKLLEWFANYELWVQDAAGREWRDSALRQRSRGPAFDAAEMPILWREFARKVEASTSH
jgi:hypothetical protein